MPPTTLLADPSIRLAGMRPRVRAPRGDGRQQGAASAGCGRGWLGLAAVLVIAAGGLGFLGTWPPLATVMSASMEPTIKTGDVVVLRKLTGPPRVGEIVAVTVPPNIRTRFGYPPVIIHRIIKIDGDGVVTTKGDAYKETDPFDVPASALTTKVVATVPAAGRVLGFLGSSLGLLWLAGGVLMFVGMPLLERYRDVQRRDEHDRTDLHDTLRSVTEELALMRVERDRELDAAAREAAESEQQRAAERDAAKRDAARLEQLRAAERDRELRAAVEAAAAAQEQLRAANAALTKHLEDLPAQIERAVAAAISAFVTPPAPPPPARMPGSVAASAWTAPTPAPDLIGVLEHCAVAASAWDAPPADVEIRTGRFHVRGKAVDFAGLRSS